MKYEVCKGDHNNLGIERNGAVTIFSVENKAGKESTLVLYPKKKGETVRIPMQKDENQTSIYSVGVKNLPTEEYEYIYELDGAPVLDPYAERIVGREVWADKARKKENIKCGFNQKERFAWGDDRLPGIPKQDMVMYKLHVRGFSMLQRLPEEEKGTFRGIERKLSYFKELGITTLEFMPVYEFEELFALDEYQHEMFPADKVNYWGYTRGNYFALKSAYLGKGKTARAFKQLVRSMHRENMECILEFYFDDKLNPHYIIDVLRYWSKEYHVDGFHVICNSTMAELIAKDYHLSGRKLFFEWFSEEMCEQGNYAMELFTYNDAFLYGVRKLINHHGGTTQEFADNMRRQQKNQGFVNYLATNNGFTLYDMFAYNEKKNQANGEENRDGLSWNCSNNCGEEGPSRKKHVNQLRERQIKNALCTLMFAQGVPLIWMGDECANSQEGNNNAYCQDNEIGWKSWENTRRSKEILSFLKQLFHLRKKYPVLHSPLPMEMNDYKGTGYPDLSYHGNDGWRMETDGNDKIIGMMYSCQYVKENKWENEKINEDYIYVGYNFSASEQKLALPALPKGYRWHYVLDTGAEGTFEERLLESDARTFDIQRQSVCMLAGRRED